MQGLAGRIVHHVCRHLARQGWLEGVAFLTGSAASGGGMDVLRTRSIACRIATIKHAGHKVITLQTLPD